MTHAPRRMSPLAKCWLLDLDGTLIIHNSHLNGGDRLAPRAEAFTRQITPGDRVIILTSRPRDACDKALKLLADIGLRADHLICDLPPGERILINDKKPSGLVTAFCTSPARDQGIDFPIIRDPAL